MIADLHLPMGAGKPMDIFEGWDNYVGRLEENWRRTVGEEDTVVIPGDISWAAGLEQSLADFRFIEALPGKKIIGKGNHDHWWNTVSKLNRFFGENDIRSISILHNNHYRYGDIGICGTRGWINDASEPADAKVLAREAGRLETSVRSALSEGLSPVVFLHYPPVYGNECNYDILDVLYKYGVKQCFYGHIHGSGHRLAVNGERDGIDFRLISSDYIQFLPYRVM